MTMLMTSFDARVRAMHPLSANAAGKMEIFNWANQFLQEKVDLYEATLDIAARLRDEHHVVHLELRFCPTLHTLGGLSEVDATTAVVAGFNASGLSGGIIICALRTLSPTHWQAMVRELRSSPTICTTSKSGWGRYRLELVVWVEYNPCTVRTGLV